MHLVKRIPLGGGLGGGSADAAAVLRWAGCADLASPSGSASDVPFCLVGGRARVEGWGSGSPRCPSRPGTTLLLPPFGVDTAASTGPGTRTAGAAAPNALTAAAWPWSPAWPSWRDALRELAGAEPTLAGSGSTWFVEGGPPAEAPRTELWRTETARLVRARTVPAGWEGELRGVIGRRRSYLPARRCQRVAFSIFLCFLRIRLRRYLSGPAPSCTAFRGSACFRERA